MVPNDDTFTCGNGGHPILHAPLPLGGAVLENPVETDQQGQEN